MTDREEELKKAVAGAKQDLIAEINNPEKSLARITVLRFRWKDMQAGLNYYRKQRIAKLEAKHATG